MFKFGFTIDGETNNQEEEQDDQIESFKWIESKQIDSKQFTHSDEVDFDTIVRSYYVIKHVSIGEVLIDLINNEEKSDCSLLSAEQNHSDLVTSKYEGGLKIWECTYDLLNFIDDEGFGFSNKMVLDLGCGAGLLGIACSLKGACTVYQDYNSEVVTSITIPNVHLNSIKLDLCSFYYGDWESFTNLVENKYKFDYIFTSETIYNVDNYSKLINLFTKLLKKEGEIYLAAKHYYFGVGGGIAQFLDHLQAFNHSTVWECKDGVKRAIIKITLK